MRRSCLPRTSSSKQNSIPMAFVKPWFSSHTHPLWQTVFLSLNPMSVRFQPCTHEKTFLLTKNQFQQTKFHPNAHAKLRFNSYAYLLCQAFHSTRAKLCLSPFAKPPPSPICQNLHWRNWPEMVAGLPWFTCRHVGSPIFEPEVVVHSGTVFFGALWDYFFFFHWIHLHIVLAYYLIYLQAHFVIF